MKRAKTTRPATALGLLILAVGLVSAAESSLVFHDDFESGVDAWEMTDPSAWSIIEDADRGHVLALEGASDYQPPHRSPHNIALVKDLEVKSFELTVDLKQTGREYGHRDLCLFFGHQDPGHFYYVHLASKADDHAHSIFIVNGAARTSIAESRTDGTQWDDSYHRVRIRRNVASGAIEVYFDDMTAPIMKATDTTFGAGRVGVGSFDDVGRFDDFKVVAIEPASG